MDKKQEFKHIKEKIKIHAPLVADFLDCKKNLVTYSKEIYDFEVSEKYFERQKPIKQFVVKKIRKLFPDEKFDLEDFKKKPLACNIVDHHGIINHPILVASNIISNFYNLFKEPNKPIIVLSCAGIPFNNFFHKKGFNFSGKKINIFTDKNCRKIAYFYPKIKFNFINKIKKNKKIKNFNESEISFLRQMETLLNQKSNSKTTNYLDQITLINYNIWPLLFSKNLRKNLKKLIYISQEKIVRYILMNFLLKDKNNFIYKILFDEKITNKTIKTFKGIIGCWDEKEEKGTHFFWRNDNSGRDIPLYFKDGFLTPLDEKDKKLRIKLEPKSIYDALKKNIIYSNLFLTYGVLTFYSGVRSLSGYGSMNYLYNMKKGWIKLLKEIGFEKEAEDISKMNMKCFIGGPIVSYKRKNKKLVKQYAFDIIFKGGFTKDYIENLGKLSFSDILKPALLDIYESYVPIDERIELKTTVQDFLGESFDGIK